MSIKYRLYGGFGILVVLTLGLVVFGVQELNAISMSVTKMNGISENSTRTLLIARYLETLRRSVLRFAYDHDEASRKENGEVAALTLSTLQAAEQQTPTEERKKAFRDVQEQLAGIQKTSQKLFDGVSQIDGTQQKLSKASGGLTAAANALIDKVQAGTDVMLVRLALKLDSQLNLMRVISLRAQVLTNVDSMPALAESVDKIMGTITAIDATAADDVVMLADPLKGAVKAFQTTVQGVVAAQHQAHDLFANQIAPQIGKAQATIETVRQQLQTNFNDNRTAVRSTIDSTILYQEIVGGIVLLAAALIAFLIARSVSNPILALTKGMRELAEGNFGVVLPGLKRKDEIGNIAKAVEAFKVKAAEKAQARGAGQGRAGPSGRSRTSGRHGEDGQRVRGRRSAASCSRRSPATSPSASSSTARPGWCSMSAPRSTRCATMSPRRSAT